MDPNYFDYILRKIEDSEMILEPFPHLEIKDFLNEDDLKIILEDKQIHFDPVNYDDKLYSTLLKNKYAIQSFPGCTNNWKVYKNHFNKPYKDRYNNPVEGVGMAFRLKNSKNAFIRELLTFMNSNKFKKALEDKFEVKKKTTIISAIQKYLNGYEISPNPDVRKKCLTYLLNINKDDSVENYDIHTHLLKFKEEYSMIPEFWKERTGINRCWVPWNWCDTVRRMSENNTMLIFQPASSPPTLHAVKLDYDHKQFQRTQIYGNLMYVNPPSCASTNWKELSKSLNIK